MEIPVSVRGRCFFPRGKDSLINITTVSETLHLMKKAPDSHPAPAWPHLQPLSWARRRPHVGVCRNTPEFPPRCTSEDLAAERPRHRVAKSEGSEES